MVKHEKGPWQQQETRFGCLLNVVDAKKIAGSQSEAR